MLESQLDIKFLDIVSIKKDVIDGYQNLSARCLYKSSKWFAEILYILEDFELSSYSSTIINDKSYFLTKSYYDSKEYDRASYFSQNKENSILSFIHYYSKYQSLNFKSNPCFQIPSVDYADELSDSEEGFSTLYGRLNDLSIKGKIDGYHLYLIGILLVKKGCKQEAKDIFLKSIEDVPLLWASWHELASLIEDTDEMDKLKLPNIWIKEFFLAQCYMHNNKWEEALTLYQSLEENGFRGCSHISNNVANIYFQMREMEESFKKFEERQKHDPFCLENLDIYSNVLYVLEKEEELCNLAHHCQEIDPLRPESCCVIGNFYSLRGERLKAIVYFQRAITLNPNFYTAWILIGHEYNELKNMSAAINAYHKALDIKPNDYRAWNGFGITYEILRMPAYSLYYYQKAHLLNPTDSRLLMAIGDAYEKLGKYLQAKKCYERAIACGDDENTGSFKLAEVSEKLDDADTAVLAYTKYLKEAETLKSGNSVQEAKALKYLGTHYFNTGQWARSFSYFEKGIRYIESAEDSRAMLEKISQILVPKIVETFNR